MKTINISLAILTLGLLCSCGGGGGGSGSGPTSSTNGGPVPNTVTGTIMYKGSPMAGVTVTAMNTNSNPSTTFGVTTTDANGNYSFTGLQTGCNCVVNYQFFPSKAGYAFYPSLAGSAAVSPVDYQWDPAPQNWSVNTGAAVTRAGYNGQFSSATGSAGIIFTVINYNSLPSNSITGADFVAYDGHDPLVQLAATGQTISYVSGDDASKNPGVAWPSTRYIDNQDGTVTDNLTGLVWLKNAGCFTPAVWANAVSDAHQLASGQCGLTDGSSAGEWRLPNLVELESMVDVSASNPVVTAGSPFTNVSNGIYWSSTVYFGGQEGTAEAWAIRFSNGSYVNDSVNNVMLTSNNAVWAVKGAGGGSVKLQATGAYVPFASGDDGSEERGVPLTSPRMLDNGNGTFTDSVTGLIWMKQADCINQPWAAAVAAVNALASGQCGLTDGSVAGDWRMPNRKEMQSLADRAQNNQSDYFDEAFTSGSNGISNHPAIFTNFIQVQYYWTSSTNASDISEAWTVFSCDFGVWNIAKTNTGYTLAVR